MENTVPPADPPEEKKSFFSGFIYTIIIAILIIILVVLGSWVLYLRFQSFGCITNFNIWCSDDWVCQNNCDSTYPVIPFQTGTSPQLASRLYGPTSLLATTCSSDTIAESGTATCACATPNTSNCLSGCPRNSSEVVPGVACCLKTGNNAACAGASS
jgi:hypothetical protein